MALNPRIDFYVLARPAPNGRLRLACRVTEKAYRAGHRIHLLTQDEPQANTLDDLLWTFSQSSFIPHSLATQASDGDTPPPVLVGSQLPAPASVDTLISLAGEPIGSYAEFERIAEIVGAEDEEKLAGRRHYRFYREHGLTPNTHTISPH